VFWNDKRFVGFQNKILTLLQGLVSDFDAMVSVIGSLSDKAVAKFDQQVAAAKAMAASAGDAITAMKEAAALTAQLSQKYLQQTIMLQDATGTAGMSWVCDRTWAYPLEWKINRQDSLLRLLLTTLINFRRSGTVVHAMLGCGRCWIRLTIYICMYMLPFMPWHRCHQSPMLVKICCRSLPGTSGAHGRRLLVSNAGPDTVLAPSQQDSWQGYQLSQATALRHRPLVDERNALEPDRYIGAAEGHNKIVAGLFLHATRKTRTASCNGELWLAVHAVEI
jgi:hypothetical protein